MLFNSIEFVLFFAAVFVLHNILLKGRTRIQNIALLVASYFFYGYADLKMLPLLAIATLLFYFLGIAIGKAQTDRANNILSIIGIAAGVGILLYFKYLNFFIDSFARLFDSWGLHTNIHTFRIVMPLGISFFTFRLISYIVEIHRGMIEPTRDLVSFATYIAFFPCILSGPIDRPDFMDQLQRPHVFDYDKAVDGMRQILWGLFKKCVIADNCAIYVDHVWDGFSTMSASSLVLAAILYAFQLYADFSGYSDMAIGVGKLLGFKITDNFKYPFFATNIANFWRRWHISLTSWVTDYVFMPLNIMFRNLGKFGIILAIMINMLIVGMWHEANWTCFFYGLYHGLLFIPLILTGSFNKREQLRTNRLGLPVIGDFGKMLLTFILVTLSFIIFRADNIVQAWSFVSGFASKSLFSIPWLMTRGFYIPLFLCIILMLGVEWVQREKAHGLDLSGISPHWIKFSIYFLLLAIILLMGETSNEFIYFQF
jgi:D-alanyl-lipoteichoic acid acyltransferase DltB (MBOAT superfamily)